MKTRFEKKNIERLEQMMQYLDEKADKYEKKTGSSAFYDRANAGALAWALQVICQQFINEEARDGEEKSE